MTETCHQKTRLGSLALGALGVVYGDIGTSPLYAFQDTFTGSYHPIPVSEENVLGILSIIFWALMIVVSLKYVYFIMQADNKGEGGIIAIMAMALRKQRVESKRYFYIMMLGIFGAALFYGDGVVTPAISVLSAIEGLNIATPAFKGYVIPITVVILTFLFYFQHKGTSTIGKWFGPIMTLWFFTIAGLGLYNIFSYPYVLASLNPLYGLKFILREPLIVFFSLGTVVLVLTGVEALYADMGHFGRKPIQMAWFGLVLPALTLCYMGQGALILHDPTAIKNPFYLLAPHWALIPLAILATIATVIASQAVISGAYSMTQQAIQLGYAPRMQITHTCADEKGQVYLSFINWMLYIIVISLVIGFKSSSNLAAAFGIAVSGTMSITTYLAYLVVRNEWEWSKGRAILGATPFAIIDLLFLSANLAKIDQGGWFPLVFGIIIFILMTTWKQGRQLLQIRMQGESMDLVVFIDSVSSEVQRISGTAVFMTTHLDKVPGALLHSLKHYGVLHERIVLVSVNFQDIPHVPDTHRLTIQALAHQFWCIKIEYGFMDKVNVPRALSLCKSAGLCFDAMQTTFFIGRETIIPRVSKDMAYWREQLFITMARNAEPATSYFKMPPNRVIELGSQITL